MQTTMSRTGLGIGLGIGVGPGNSLGVGEGPGEGERFEQKSVTEAVSKPVTTENQTPLASEDEEPTPESELESENEHPLDRYHRLKRTLSPEAFVRFERQFQNDYPNMWAQVNGSDEDCPECGGRLYDWINHKCPAPTNRSLS
jgi:phage repressor protein C with HTH and peptisase S24 domain